MRHLDFTGESATCAKCEIEVSLPSDGATWPARRRIRIGAAWVEITPARVRPGGSEGIGMPPKWDALTDFLIAHKHDGEGR